MGPFLHTFGHFCSKHLAHRYIGGCCGFEAFHIRAISEELQAERGGKISKGSEKHDLWGGGLVMHTKPWVRARYCPAIFGQVRLG